MKQELIQKQEATQIPNTEILNDSDRIFKSWGSVEVKDKDGDLLPMDEFRKIMPTIMKRGGIITDRHSNRVVGKILNYEFKMKETPEGPREGVFLTGQVFNDYDLDDAVWELIKEGGIQGMSFGGRNKFEDLKFEKGMDVTKVLTGLEGYEFALVPSMANQEAEMEEINFLAKGKKENKKGFAGFKDFADCVSQNQDKDNPEAFCGFLQARVEKAEKEFNKEKSTHTDNKDKKKEDNLIIHTLPPISETNEKLIKNNTLDKSMTQNNVQLKELLKALLNKIEEDDIPQEDDSEDEKKTKKVKKESKEAPTESTPAETPSTPAEVPKEEEKTEVEKEGEGEKVTLPKTADEVAQDESPGEGEKNDEVKFVEKIKKEITADIKKSLNIGAESTPRPNMGQNLNKSRALPKTWKEMNALARGIN